MFVDTTAVLHKKVGEIAKTQKKVSSLRKKITQNINKQKKTRINPNGDAGLES